MKTKFMKKLSFKNGEWELNAGQIDGYEQGNQVFIYPLDTLISSESTVLETLTIEACQIQKSLLSTSDILDTHSEYQALVYNTSYPLAFEFKGTNEGVECLQALLDTEVVKEKLLYAEIFYEKLDSKYYILCSEENYQIYKHGRSGEHLLFTTLGSSEEQALKILQKLEFYLYWEQNLNTNNSNELNEMLDFNISYKGGVYHNNFLTIDDHSYDNANEANQYNYVCKLSSNVRDETNLSLSMLIFDEYGEEIYEGFKTSSMKVAKHQRVYGQNAFYFTSDEVSKGIYDKNYFLKVYIFNEAKSMWASKTIKLNTLYATPFKMSSTQEIDFYKGIKIKAHKSPATITLMTTQSITALKDFPPAVTYKQHAPSNYNAVGM